MEQNKMTPAPWHIDAFDLRNIKATMNEVAKNYYQLAKCNINRDGSTMAEDHANANAIVTAVNSTYGAGINPEAVPDMLLALEIAKGYFDEATIAGKAIKAAIEKAKINL